MSNPRSTYTNSVWAIDTRANIKYFEYETTQFLPFYENVFDDMNVDMTSWKTEKENFRDIIFSLGLTMCPLNQTYHRAASASENLFST